MRLLLVQHLTLGITSLDNVDKQLDTFAEIEQRIEALAVAGLKKQYASLIKQLESLWPGDDATDTDKAKVIKRLNVDGMLYHVPGAIATIKEGALEALSEGVETGMRGARKGGLRIKDTFKRLLTASLEDKTQHVRTAVSEQVSKAKTVLKRAKTLKQARAGVVIAGQSVTRVGMIARDVVNTAANEGLNTVAERYQGDLISIWVAERDACVECLKRQGQTSDTHPNNFAEPAHPNCRCTRIVLVRDASAAYISALKREAQRSILKGFSLPSESNAKRIKAAADLLKQGTNLPKSVKEYARKAVKRGEFPSGRDFPGVR